MSNYIKILASMIMNRVEFGLVTDAERKQGKLGRAVSELATALRGDAQTNGKRHHPKSPNQK
jgi:hypothetical protein